MALTEDEEIRTSLTKSQDFDGRFATIVDLDSKFQGSTCTAIGMAVVVIFMSLSGLVVSLLTTPWWNYVIQILLASGAVVSLYINFVLDPGVIMPSFQIDPLVLQAEADARRAQEYGMSKNRYGAWQQTRPDGVYRYCDTCNVWRPPRAHHCKICGFCMERFDHHCDVVGTCVARNNHRFFTAFLLLCLLGLLHLVGSSIWHLRNVGFMTGKPSSFDRWDTWATVALMVLQIYLALVSSFGCYHLILLLTGFTTKDCVTRGERNDIALMPCCPGESPQGGGYREVFCAPMKTKTMLLREIQAQQAELQLSVP